MKRSLLRTLTSKEPSGSAVAFLVQKCPLGVGEWNCDIVGHLQASFGPFGPNSENKREGLDKGSWASRPAGPKKSELKKEFKK